MTGMDASARAWLVTVSLDHFWRVPGWYELDDLIQDGHLVWWRVVQKYETETGRVRNRAHLMRLFKRSFLNHIHDLSKSKTVARCEVHAIDMVANNVGEFWHDVWDFVAPARNVEEFNLLIAEAPAPIKPLLRALVDAASLPIMRALYRVAADGTREMVNDRLCRLVGVDPTQSDLATELRAYLSHEPSAGAV